MNPASIAASATPCSVRLSHPDRVSRRRAAREVGPYERDKRRVSLVCSASGRCLQEAHCALGQRECPMHLNSVFMEISSFAGLIMQRAQRLPRTTFR